MTSHPPSLLQALGKYPLELSITRTDPAEPLPGGFLAGEGDAFKPLLWGQTCFGLGIPQGVAGDGLGLAGEM